ncbi:MAG: hypothetical protein HY720_06305, partial [Planctomycetes bacterium]|nr:hypothetical protein [Planctomycetota bacterium]
MSGSAGARRKRTERVQSQGPRRGGRRIPLIWIGAGGGALLALVILAVFFATRPSSGERQAQVAGPTTPGASSPEQPTSDGSPAPPVDAGPRPGRSRALLEEIGGKLPHLVDREGGLYLEEGGATFPILSVRLGNPVAASEMGKIEIDAGLLSADRPGLGSSLVALVALAKAAGFGAKSAGGDSGFVYEWDFLLGFHLRAEDRVVLAEGVATREALPGGGVTADVGTVAKAVERFEAAVGPTLPPLARTVLFDLVGLLADRDGEAEIDEFPPSFARRLVRHGWLDRVLPEAAREHARALEAGLDEATRFRPIETFKGEGLALTKFEDAFGKGGWLLQAPARTAYTLTPPRPHYHPKAWEGLRDARLVVELPGGVDPNRREDFWKETTALRLFHRGTLLASWEKEAGFRADQAAWRRVVPELGSGGVLKTLLPPHLLLVDLAGDVRALFTPHGRLVPPQDATPAESDRFLAEAVAALPDPPHLDLFGEYFFQYVYDSPDTANPSLVGNKKQRGDIHQTARETLSSVFGGMCRGDCDDLSEMYAEIATRQGKLAHVLYLPAHAAAAWA